MELGPMGRSVATLSAAVVLLAGCTGGGEDGYAAPDDPLPAADGPTGSDEPAVQEATASLAELNGSGVTGDASLRWDPASRVLTVTVRLEGLEPDARYSSQVTPGCAMGSGHIHKLDDLVAGPGGAAEQTTDIAGVEAVDFDSDWSVKVGRPPAGGGQGGGTPGGGSPVRAGPQACGDVAATP